MSDQSAMGKAAPVKHLQASRPRSFSLTQQPLLLTLNQQSGSPLAGESSRSEAEDEDESVNNKGHKKKDKKKDKDKKKRVAAEPRPPAPPVAKAVSEPSSTRTRALRRCDSEHAFRNDVLSILDAQQEAIMRMAAAVETLQQQQQAAACCMGRGGGGGVACILL